MTLFNLFQDVFPQFGYLCRENLISQKFLGQCNKPVSDRLPQAFIVLRSLLRIGRDLDKPADLIIVDIHFLIYRGKDRKQLIEPVDTLPGGNGGELGQTYQLSLAVTESANLSRRYPSAQTYLRPPRIRYKREIFLGMSR
jgi:hypothetical protein